MSKVTIPSIAFNRMRNDVYRLVGLEYIPPELREQTNKLMIVLDMLDAKFTAAYFEHTQSPSKLTDKQRAKLSDARADAIRRAQIAVNEKRLVSSNPFPAGELHNEWRKAWYFYSQPGGHDNRLYPDFVPPDDD
jgi:hypothetical protein